MLVNYLTLLVLSYLFESSSILPYAICLVYRVSPKGAPVPSNDEVVAIGKRSSRLSPQRSLSVLRLIESLSYPVLLVVVAEKSLTTSMSQRFCTIPSVLIH